MYILGFTNGIDSGVALVKNGKLVFAIGEERLSRIKLDDSFPSCALEKALAYEGITLNDIDVVSYAWHYRFPYEKHLHDFIARCVEIAKTGENAQSIMLERVAVEMARDVSRKEDFDRHMKRLGLLDRVEYFDHHEAHAANTYFMSPFSKALVITSDAKGNYRASTVSIAKGSEMEEVSCSYSFDSLGFFYGQITEYLGFKPHRHEGKVTGLAAYGNSQKCLHIMQRMITTENGKIYGHLDKYYKPFYTNQHKALRRELKKYSMEDIAAAAQKHLEDIVIDYISYYVKKYKIGTIACSGGIFGNVKLNQHIREIPQVKDVFIFPHMGDGGLPVGAALLSWQKRSKRKFPLADVYLGTATDEKSIKTAVKKYKNKIKVTSYKRDDLVKETTSLLKRDKVVGLFQGRMEYGPRALGNRSILYHANDKEANNWLNKRLHRTEFMPFAPVTIEELAPRCFKGWKKHHLNSRFMTECYNCTSEMKKNSPAVVHIDGTARPQVIARKDNPFYYDIVKTWFEETGGFCLINTSFNQHEEPIVCGIEDAIESLLRDNIDCIVVESKYIFEKNN